MSTRPSVSTDALKARKLTAGDAAADATKLDTTNPKPGAANSSLGDRLPSYALGKSDGGPGTWIQNGPFGKPADQCYQCQVTGAPSGVEYQVNGVNFDGYDPKTNTLIDAKNYVDWPIDKPFSTKTVLQQAQDQMYAAKGTGAAIEWRVATPEKADMVRSILEGNGNIPIKVTVQPAKGP